MVVEVYQLPAKVCALSARGKHSLESMWESIPLCTSLHITHQTVCRETNDIIDENGGLTLMFDENGGLTLMSYKFCRIVK